MSEDQEHSGTPETGANVSRETSGPEKNKRSSVYVYLIILFGAAFLMLLLAYFVQQRNNESTISGLQNSWDLSREELVEKNQTLEEENEALHTMIDSLSAEQAELREAYDEEFSTNRQRQSELANQITSWSLFWAMESAFRDEDYETCAGFFQDGFTSETYTAPAEAEERIEEIHQELARLGYLPEEGGPAGE